MIIVVTKQINAQNAHSLPKISASGPSGYLMGLFMVLDDLQIFQSIGSIPLLVKYSLVFEK